MASNIFDSTTLISPVASLCQIQSSLMWAALSRGRGKDTEAVGPKGPMRTCSGADHAAAAAGLGHCPGCSFKSRCPGEPRGAGRGSVAVGADHRPCSGSTPALLTHLLRGNLWVGRSRSPTATGAGRGVAGPAGPLPGPRCMTSAAKALRVTIWTAWEPSNTSDLPPPPVPLWNRVTSGPGTVRY